MQIQVNSDKNIPVDRRLALFVRDEAGRALERFKDKLTRVEFHLSDVNGPRFGKLDKRCLVEARPARHRPVAVRATAPTVRSAVQTSLSKLRTALETFFGRLRTRRASARRTAKSALPRVSSKGTQPEQLIAEPVGYTVRPPKKSVTRAPRTNQAAAKKVTATKAASTRPASSGRGPKKKKIYQARRKVWPKR